MVYLCSPKKRSRFVAYKSCESSKRSPKLLKKLGSGTTCMGTTTSCACSQQSACSTRSDTKSSSRVSPIWSENTRAFFHACKTSFTQQHEAWKCRCYFSCALWERSVSAKNKQQSSVYVCIHFSGSSSPRMHTNLERRETMFSFHPHEPLSRTTSQVALVFALRAKEIIENDFFRGRKKNLARKHMCKARQLFRACMGWHSSAVRS